MDVKHVVIKVGPASLPAVNIMSGEEANKFVTDYLANGYVIKHCQVMAPDQSGYTIFYLFVKSPVK